MKIITTAWQSYPYKRMYFFFEINGELTEMHLWSEDIIAKREIFQMPYKFIDSPICHPLSASKEKVQTNIDYSFRWEYIKQEEERRRFHEEGHIQMGVRLNPPKKII